MLRESLEGALLVSALSALLAFGCESDPATDTETGTETGDSDPSGDGDGDPSTGDGDGDPTGDGDGDPTGDGDGDPTGEMHQMLCELTTGLIPEVEGYAVPGVASAPRWGIPDAPPDPLRVRRSWSSLDDTAKREVIDAFIALKSVTVDSGDPGSARADYTSFCEEPELQPYAKNLYDYYVEAHMNAFMSMRSPLMTMEDMPHKGPQFLTWHRYLILRIEADLREVSGNPDFALPYWDWTDCYTDDDPTTCAPIFELEHLGSAGGCDDNSEAVAGYLIDEGFAVNVSSGAFPQSFALAGVTCTPRELRRRVACSESVTGPAGAEAIAAMFARTTFDAPPYDACNTEEDVSFRQYLEGFDNTNLDPVCVAAGCGMHGRGHEWIGGDMTSPSTPNDPMFFLHHANVDRLWAAWQQANLDSGEADRAIDYGNPGYPDSHRVPLFNWPQVDAEEMFDYRALGYEYDSLPSG